MSCGDSGWNRLDAQGIQLRFSAQIKSCGWLSLVSYGRSGPKVWTARRPVLQTFPFPVFFGMGSGVNWCGMNPVGSGVKDPLLTQVLWVALWRTHHSPPRHQNRIGFGRKTESQYVGGIEIFCRCPNLWVALWRTHHNPPLHLNRIRFGWKEV